MNPYEELGVSPSASPEEIREAYMKLVKKYHPDRYQDSNLKKQAEEKMKRINAAYDTITKNQAQAQSQAQNGYGSGSYGSAGYGGYGAGYGQSGPRPGYTGSYANEFAKVRAYINSGNIAAALALLNAIPLHNAEWNFLYGMCCYRNGEYSKAYDHVSRACQMDPNNAEYASALNGMRGASSTRSAWTGTGESLRCCGLCGSIVCANLLCSCCRGLS